MLHAVIILIAAAGFYWLFGKRITGKRKPVGHAYIEIRPDIKGFSDRLQAELADTTRQIRYAELIATHGLIADPEIPDCDTPTVFRCTGCAFTGITRLAHAFHIVARFVQIEEADRRLADAIRNHGAAQHQPPRSM